MKSALGSTLLALLVVGAAVTYALRLPADSRMWLEMGLPYVALSVVAAVRLQRLRLLRPILTFRPGDPSIGIGVGVVLVIAAWELGKLFFPSDGVQHAWLLRVFLLAGDTSTAYTTSWLLLLAASEELVWRGWVQVELSRELGARAGWVVGASVYAVAHTATLITLRDPVAGPNPVLVLAALGCGLCWAFLRERTGRLWPGVFSHAAFTYLASQFLWRFM